MESRPAGANQKMVDLAETAGHGFLGEMSIAELRERLALLKAEDKKEEEKRRDAIVAEKQEKEKMLQLALEKIHRHRTVQTKTNAEKLEEKREKRSEKPKCQDAAVLTLRDQLEEKRKERIKAKEEAAIAPNRETNARLKALNREKQRQHDEGSPGEREGGRETGNTLRATHFRQQLLTDVR